MRKLALIICLLVWLYLPAVAAQPVVAIHVSEVTQALETTAAGPSTPSGADTTGKEWWTPWWHYFVMPESMKEALRSDGTAFATVTDAQISAGSLLNPDGSPKYPIVISLASEAIRDDEIEEPVSAEAQQQWQHHPDDGTPAHAHQKPDEQGMRNNGGQN